MTDQAFDSMRLWLCVVLSLVRIVSAPSCFQAYLNLAQEKIESMKKEAGRISNVELQKKVFQHKAYYKENFMIGFTFLGGYNFLLPLRSWITIFRTDYTVRWIYVDE